MIVSIVMASSPTTFLREFTLSARDVYVSNARLNVCVDEFTDFLSIMYRTFARLSRGSESICMRLPVICEVKGHRFFVRVVEGGIRYGEL